MSAPSAEAAEKPPAITGREFWAVARRPRWIAALVLALAIAAGFAALGQWQLSRAVEANEVAASSTTETPVALDGFAQPQTAVTTTQDGQKVTATGTLVASDTAVLSNRQQNGAGGWWLVARAVTTAGGAPASVIVALGWAPTEDLARAAIPSLPTGTIPLDGRYLAGESPTESDYQKGEHSALSPAELANQWADDPGAMFDGYIVLGTATPGLQTISAPPPSDDTGLNLLNLFYALEWAVFAGFAVYLWYRLVRDVVEAQKLESMATAPTEAAETAKVD